MDTRQKGRESERVKIERDKVIDYIIISFGISDKTSQSSFLLNTKRKEERILRKGGKVERIWKYRMN